VTSAITRLRARPDVGYGFDIGFHFDAMPTKTWRNLAALTVLGALLGSACGGASAGTDSSGRLRVVAAENVYGDIVRQLGGSHVSVSSILTDPRADPHLFEPGTVAAGLVAQAGLVIENGLGYDAFIDRLVKAAPNADRRVVTISNALGITDPAANPHIWYDVPRLPQVAKAIADGLAAADANNRSFYEARLSAFDRSLKPLEDAVAALKSRFAGTPVAYTEPVPGYLLQATGLDVRTPEEFARSIEEGNEPTPQAVAAMEALFTQRLVRVLLYNSQATSPITERIRTLATQNGIPVVPVTETLPPRMTFQHWQLRQVQALTKALGG
jgi:zinc/manganese transport system substrate-binding protein